MNAPATRALVGRAAETLESKAALEHLLAGRGRVVLFVGEAGIGKTTLADAMTDEARAAGVRVAWGRCWEAGGAPAFWPWTQIFRALDEEDPFATATDAAAAEANDVRFRVFDRVVERLRNLARATPLLLVLDDLHAADVPSLLLFQFVARSLRGGARLGIVATYRDAEARVAGEVGAILAKVARDAEVVAPARLSREEVAAWVRAREPDASDALVGRVYAASEGNPLFVDELMRVRRALDVGALPDGLRAVLDEHIARVSVPTAELLSIASIFGREASDAELVALTHAPEDDVAQRVAEARAAGLLVALGPGRHAFAHMLLRDRLYEALAPSRRSELHRAAGERFARAGDHASASHHFFAGSDNERAAAAACDAARVALAQLAFEDAESLAARALSVVPAGSRLEAELTLLRAEALVRVGRTAEGRAVALRAADLAAAAHEPRLVAQAAIVHGVDIQSGTIDPTQVALMRRAVAGLPEGDEPLRARLLARLAASLVPVRNLAEFEEANGYADAALAMARRLGDPDTLLYVLRFAGSAKGYGVSSAERYALFDETIALATSLDRATILLELMAVQAALLRERGDRVASERALDRWSALVRAHPRPQYTWRLPLVFAGHALLDGDEERAERNAAEALALAEENGQFPGMIAWAMQRLSFALLRNDVRVIAKDAPKILSIIERVPSFDFMRALFWFAMGREDEARRALASYVFHPEDVPRVCMASVAAMMLHDEALAARVLDPLLAASKHTPLFWGVQGASMLGPLALWCAVLLRRAGRDAEARAKLDEAAVTAERMQVPWLVEQIQTERAQLGRAARAPEVAPRSRRGSAPHATSLSLERDGEVWRLAGAEFAPLTLKDAKGLHYLAELLRHEGNDVHVTELVGIDDAAGDVGPVLDAKAKAAYRERFEALREEHDEAKRHDDLGRTARIEREMEALSDQLAAAVGLGGRDRKLGSHVERARINVQRRLKDVFRRVGEQDPAFGRWLEASVKTGVWCSFRPI